MMYLQLNDFKALAQMCSRILTQATPDPDHVTLAEEFSTKTLMNEQALIIFFKPNKNR